MHSLSSAFAPWNPISANVWGLLLLFPPPIGTGVLIVLVAVLVVVVEAGVGSPTPVAVAAEETGKGLGVPVVVVDGVGGTAPGSSKFNLNFAAAPAFTAEGLGLLALPAPTRRAGLGSLPPTGAGGVFRPDGLSVRYGYGPYA